MPTTTKDLHVWLGSTYRLEWRVPRTPVVNVFVNAPPPHGDGNKQSFPHPDPGPSNAFEMEITVRSGPDAANLQPDFFFENRTPPTVIERAVSAKKMAKFFAVTFKARRLGVFEFTIKGPGKHTIVQQITVRKKTHYRTIQEVMDDPTALRRQAILAAVFDIIPAFNTNSGSTTGVMGEKVGTPSKIMGQGDWVSRYLFPQGTGGTSCVTVNPLLMKTGDAVNSSDKWAFSVGPVHPPGNVAWYYCTDEYIPSVGDTYIALNPYKLPAYGHVGLVLHVPPTGNGLWVTADGGQGQKPRQLGVMVPRWGLMGAKLPLTGNPPGKYKDMVPEPNSGPFLSGATAVDIIDGAPTPKDDDDIQGIINRIVFRQTFAAQKTSCPRRMEGFADVDHPKLTFPKLTGKSRNDAHIAKCKQLQTKVNAVMSKFRGGELLNLAGTT